MSQTPLKIAAKVNSSPFTWGLYFTDSWSWPLIENETSPNE